MSFTIRDRNGELILTKLRDCIYTVRIDRQQSKSDRLNDRRLDRNIQPNATIAENDRSFHNSEASSSMKPWHSFWEMPREHFNDVILRFFLIIHPTPKTQHRWRPHTLSLLLGFWSAKIQNIRTIAEIDCIFSYSEASSSI